MEYMEYVVNYLTGAFPYAAEFMNVGMALEGAMVVRRGVNSDRKLHWFHAFLLSVVASFGGGIFNKVWMAQPSAMISNDLLMGSCILAFIMMNVIPFGFQLCRFLPTNLLITSSAMLFRSTSIPVFVRVAFLAFEDKPSRYYPIPVFGPIIYATMLGNMGAFFLKGFEKHIENGMPWPIQNGIFCAGFYHFYVNDQTGPIGQALRSAFPFAEMLGMSEATFAAAFVSLFMQITGILRMPEFLGPSFTPFAKEILSPFMDLSTWNVGKGDTIYAAKQEENQQQIQQKQEQQSNEEDHDGQHAATSTSKKKKKKKKNAGNSTVELTTSTQGAEAKKNK